MPIEIFELVVKAKVDESQQQIQNNGRERPYMECRNPTEEKHAAIADQMKEIVKRNKER